MKTIVIFCATAGLCLLQSGCAVIAVGAAAVAAGTMQDAAMRPYDRALRDGRMSPVEYARQRMQTDRAVEAVFCPAPAEGR